MMAEMNYTQRAKTNDYRCLMRRDSLLRQASIERTVNADSQRLISVQHRHLLAQSFASQVLEELNDEGVEVLLASDHQTKQRLTVLLTCDQPSLQQVVQTVLLDPLVLYHLETRLSSASSSVDCSLFLDCQTTIKALLATLERLQTNGLLKKLAIYKTDQPPSSPSSPFSQLSFSAPWFPSSIWQLDLCGQVLTKYEPEFDARHPGFGDADYIERRASLARLAAEFRQGDVIATVEYTEKEENTWKEAYNRLKTLYPSHACSEYRQNLQLLETEGLFSPNAIPQLETVSRFLQKKTGFQLRPCGGLLSARNFLASLAFRVFQATQYVRHHSAPHHSPEPDVIHELLGHVPMFIDPVLAQFSQEIGLLSLGASDQDIERLATVYWFIIEFGLCRENDGLRAIGAGLLSAYGELEHALSPIPDQRPFDPQLTAVQPYHDDHYQSVYFVAQSIFDAMQKLRSYAKSMKRPFQLIYDPITKSIKKLCNANDLTESMDKLSGDLESAVTAIKALSARQ